MIAIIQNYMRARPGGPLSVPWKPPASWEIRLPGLSIQNSPRSLFPSGRVLAGYGELRAGWRNQAAFVREPENSSRRWSKDRPQCSVHAMLSKRILVK
jgi:hypothetical protein